MKKILLALLFSMLIAPLAAQKNVDPQFEASVLPDRLLEHLNSATSKDDVRQSNARVVAEFRSLYQGFDAAMQERVASVYSTLVKLRVKPHPDLVGFTTALSLAARSTDSFDGWLQAVEMLQERKKKVKDVTDFAAFTTGLINERTLYRSKGSTWQAQQGAAFRIVVDGKTIRIHFDKPMELYYSSGSDNGTIYGTTGYYDYLDSRWQGRGGRVDWGRTGLPVAKCWALLESYEAVVKFPKFTADSVLFTNTDYFRQPIRGRLAESLSTRMSPDKYTYPKFQSYQRDFVMKDLMPGVDYSGSFMMNGANFVTSDNSHPATLIFHRGGVPFIAVTSQRFSISAARLVTQNASVRIYIDGDSICNDGITLRYNVSERKVSLLNDSKRNYYSPYSDSYHALDIYSESIVWDMAADKLLFASLGGQSGDRSFATFESSSYYSYGKFRQIQGIDEVNPVVRIHNYMKKRGMQRDFFIDELAQSLHLDLIQTKSMIHTLSGAGLVSFNESRGLITVKDKLIDYVRAHNKSKKTDYDAITLQSSSTGGNAVLSLSDNQLHIAGVEKFVVSDSQRVVIYPQHGDVTVRRNRDIAFSGDINVGRFMMHATDALFSYDSFRLELPHIDSLRFYVTQFNDPAKERLVTTPLYNLVGAIQIDDPSNRSGLRETKDYPVFYSRENSFVYYDRGDICRGAYVRDKFYYTLHPFTLKNLGNFVTDSLVFNGVLTSAGIFPDISHPLTVQPDYSLGFVTETPQGGYDTYGGKGRYWQTIDLSHKGLRGRGKLEYLVSTTRSRDILFTPDSMLALTDTFFVQPVSGYPDIYNGRAVQQWYPYQDSMRVAQRKGGTPFRLYRDETTLHGAVALTPRGASASGRAVVRDGELQSAWFALGATEMDAAVSAFVLYAARGGERPVAFRADNMRSHVDYEGRRADFVANTPLERTLLPSMNYAAYVDKFSWAMDLQTLDLVNSHSESTQGLEGLTLRERLDREQPGARFLSTKAPDRGASADSLSFYATRATYRYNDLQLSCRNVFVVRVADAAVAPDADTLHISAGGTIDMLHRAQILANTDSRQHLFYNADAIIFDAARYSAKGYIDYIDEEERRQPVRMNSIEPDSLGHTVADGFVPDSARFTLNRALGFAGKVRVLADSANYWFEGGVRLLHRCYDESHLGLLAYADFLDPHAIRVSVPRQPTDWQGRPITASILLDRGTLAAKSAFLTDDKPQDNEMLKAWGSLTYDAASNSYRIASDEKLADFDNVVAPYLTLNTESCVVEGEGPIHMGLKSGVGKVSCYGVAKVDPAVESENVLRATLELDFPIDPTLVDALAQQISDDLRLSPATADNDVLRHALIYYLGDEAGEEHYATYAATGAYGQMPAALDHTLFFEQIPWRYSAKLGYHYDGVVPLSSVGRHELHLAVRVKAQVYKRGSATHLTLYLQLAPDHWYYFDYEAGSQQLSILSSVGEWVDMIKSIPADKRQVESRRDGTFRYRVVTSSSEVPDFLLRFSQED
ncbi:MAG: hypothetical protein AUK63_1244 [bacterium P3]|nr:MAG: hypothetical protein AUK63_1244 [bacterium P3]KWW40520.1 MAG: hypothetical protein F083_1589 [bacterium F083]